MPTFYGYKVGNSITPQSRAAQIEFEKLPVAVPLRVKAVRTRNKAYHRMTWALFTYVAHALNEGPTPAVWTPDDVKDHLLVATGYCREVRVNGRVGFIPKHTNFDAMDQGEYSKFVDAAMIYVRDQLCTWIDRSEHWSQILEILKASYLIDDQHPEKETHNGP